MTREEKIEAFTMRLDGYSLQAIGDKYGLTRERIRKMLVDCVKPEKSKQDYGYINLKRWMKENGIDQNEFAKIIGLKLNSINSKINGRSDFKQSQIRKIIEITGMPYEEAFKFIEKEDEQG